MSSRVLKNPYVDLLSYIGTPVGSFYLGHFINPLFGLGSADSPERAHAGEEGGHWREKMSSSGRMALEALQEVSIVKRLFGFGMIWFYSERCESICGNTSTVSVRDLTMPSRSILYSLQAVLAEG